MSDDPLGLGDCPVCGPGTAEPEQDGDLRYWACVQCGHESGWHKVAPNSDQDCAVGISEDIRRRASIGTDRQLAGQPLLLQIGKRSS